MAGNSRADDEARTRDLNLGKVALYQLSYVRLQLPRPKALPEEEAAAKTEDGTKTAAAPATTGAEAIKH